MADLARAKRLHESIPERLLEWPRRIVEINGIDRAMVIGAQAFTAFFPLVIVASALLSAHGGADAAASFVNRFDLEGNAKSSVEAAFAAPTDVRSEIQVIGVVILVLSALSFERAIQRLYERTWRLPARGVRASGWGLVWLFGLIVWLALQPAITGLFDGVLAVAASLASATGLWLATPYLLLERRIGWRRLLPTGLITAIALSLFGVGSALVMPHALGSAANEFGAIGIAFALISWTTAIGFTLMATATAGAVVSEGISDLRRDRRNFGD